MKIKIIVIILAMVGSLTLHAAEDGSGMVNGAGLQIHLDERWSLYTSFKLRWGLMVAGAGPRGVAVDGEFPLGVIFRF